MKKNIFLLLVLTLFNGCVSQEQLASSSFQETQQRESNYERTTMQTLNKTVDSIGDGIDTIADATGDALAHIHPEDIERSFRNTRSQMYDAQFGYDKRDEKPWDDMTDEERNDWYQKNKWRYQSNDDTVTTTSGNTNNKTKTVSYSKPHYISKTCYYAIQLDSLSLLKEYDASKPSGGCLNVFRINPAKHFDNKYPYVEINNIGAKIEVIDYPIFRLYNYQEFSNGDFNIYITYARYELYKHTFKRVKPSKQYNFCEEHTSFDSEEEALEYTKNWLKSEYKGYDIYQYSSNFPNEVVFLENEIDCLEDE